MKKVMVVLVSIGLILTLTIGTAACGKKEKTTQASYDEQVFSAFVKDAFTEKEKSLTYIESSDAKHSLNLKDDKTLEIKFNASLGFGSAETGDIVYATRAEALEAAIAKINLKTEANKKTKISEADVKKQAEESIAPIPCSLSIKGKNLASRKDFSVKQTNDKGEFVVLEFEVTEIKGAGLKGTSVKVSDEVSAKACTAEKFLSEYAAGLKNGSVPEENKKTFTTGWFTLKGEDTFLKAKSGTLNFNEMSAKSLKFGEKTLEKQSSEKKDEKK